MDLTIASFDAISEVNMVSEKSKFISSCAEHELLTLSLSLCTRQDYTITIYLNQYWRDERLAYNLFENVQSDFNDLLTLSGDFAERIWVPDTFFANDKNRFVVYD